MKRALRSGRFNAQSYCAFLEEVLAQTTQPLLVVQDGARYHTATKTQEFVAKLAELAAPERKQQLVDLYQRVIDGVHDLGFPLSIHLEAPYGVTRSAFDTFSEVLRYWAPDASPGGR